MCRKSISGQGLKVPLSACSSCHSLKISLQISQTKYYSEGVFCCSDFKYGKKNTPKCIKIHAAPRTLSHNYHAHIEKKRNEQIGLSQHQPNKLKITGVMWTCLLEPTYNNTHVAFSSTIS